MMNVIQAPVTQTQKEAVADNQDTDVVVLEALLVSRTYLYALFHALFGGVPNAELIDTVRGDVTINVVDEYAQDSAPMAGLAQFLQNLGRQDRDQLLDEAKDEYTRVFVGPGTLPASPYESPYTGEHDMSLFQENTLKVRAAFRQQGLQARRVMSVPDDHIALMCDFMSILAARTLESFQDGDSAAVASSLHMQGTFTKNHLANWLDIYAKSVRNSKAGAKAVLYPQMLEAVAAFIGCDQVFCQEAAHWAQTVEGDFAAEDQCPRFPEVEDALARLHALNLVGLADNTLVRS